MKVLVTGSRDWTDGATILAALQVCAASMVIHGAQRGADLLAALAARRLGIPERGYEADWNAHGRKAGPLRNALMLAAEHHAVEPIGLVLAFPLPNSKGTWDMCERADKAGIEVRVLGDTGLRRRDTPENRAFWKSVQDAADEWRQSRPAWARRLDKQAALKDSAGHDGRIVPER